jgi:hypothetical protein
VLAQLLNRDFVLALANQASEELGDEVKRRKSRRRSIKRGPLAEFDSTDIDKLGASLGSSVEKLDDDAPAAEWSEPGGGAEDAEAPEPGGGEPPPPRPKDDFAFVPRSASLSLLQSVVEEYYETQEPAHAIRDTPLLDDRRSGKTPVVTDRRIRDVQLRRGSGGRRLWRPFEVARPKILSDPGWAWCLGAMAVRALRGRAPFVEAPQIVAIANDARIFLVGDWGSGLPRAQRVAEQVRKELAAGADTDQHVIHLGDVYYSGCEWEYLRRFLAHWPVSAGSEVRSYTLNGNHDMYAGGYGYYVTCLADPRFAGQMGCSYFALKNDHWQLIALDSSYDDGGLHGPQASWAKGLVESSDPSVKNVLLSHHQLFSAHEDGAAELGTKIRPVLETGRVDGWFWGHEHRCIHYEESDFKGARVGLASCVGHGGIPEYMIMREGEKRPAPWVYEYLKQYGDGWEPWETFGFVILEIHGPEVTLRYIDEHGTEHHRVEKAIGAKP